MISVTSLPQLEADYVYRRCVECMQRLLYERSCSARLQRLFRAASPEAAPTMASGVCFAVGTDSSGSGQPGDHLLTAVVEDPPA